LFASYAAAVGIGLVGVVLGALVVGFEEVDRAIEGYSPYILGFITVVVFPFVNRKLK
jgi:hypothetical protein